MFNKILIANRGEIACRVMRTAHRLGIGTVAVYSDADRRALHVSMADEALHIGAAPARDSYLCADRIIAAARQSGAQAIHPGYGFLSENAAFCRQCQEQGFVFIGPGPGAIETMGSKSAAKRVAAQAGVPLVPGYHGDDQGERVLREAAAAIGYPVLLKAVAGGGGKGMREVRRDDEFSAALAAARREAAAAFGDERMLVEKYLRRPRHVEIQVFRDAQGQAVHLFERDCSVQRRHQKIIEEAPAPGLAAEVRRAMGEAAVRAAHAVDYRGAGTVEFLLDEEQAFYFMEMNTRLQVEHPVTEMITGQDLVEWQLRVAAGEPLPVHQGALDMAGHAIEARLYAEDPQRDFLPVTGTLAFMQTPEESRHVRVDSGVRQGDSISVYYDPMIAKLIVWDERRERAVARLSRALSEFRVGGTRTNIEFLYNLVTSDPFKSGRVDTGFVDHHADLLLRSRQTDASRDLPLASLYLLLRREQTAAGRAHPSDPGSPWGIPDGWRLNEPYMHSGAILVNGQAHDFPVQQIGSGRERRFIMKVAGNEVIATGRLDGNALTAEIDGHRRRAVVAPHGDEYSLFTEHGASVFSLVTPDHGVADDQHAGGELLAPMNGTVVALLVEPGAEVAEHQGLLVLEAMKMEHVIRAPVNGRVQKFHFQVGDLVDGGALLLDFDAD